MQEIKLSRSPRIEQSYKDRLGELAILYKRKKHIKSIRLEDMFIDVNFLRENGSEIETMGSFYVLRNGYPYQNTKLHLVLIPRYETADMIYSLFMCAYMLIDRYGVKDSYALVDKGKGSIDYPHWHLLIY